MEGDLPTPAAVEALPLDERADAYRAALAALQDRLELPVG